MRLLSASVLTLFSSAAAIKIVDDHVVSHLVNCEAPANRIIAENCKPGNAVEEWDINGAGHPSIQGFADQQSYQAGEKVVMRIKTPSTKYRIDIYRVGYYNGMGARKVETAITHVVDLPQEQPPCHTDNATMLVDCINWHPSASWHVPSDAVSGVYFARLTREDSENIPRHWRGDASSISANPKFSNPAWDYSQPPPCGFSYNCSALKHAYGAKRRSEGAKGLMDNALFEPFASHIYFVVRNDDEQADILFQTSDTTWHAYNTYGAPNTYGMAALKHHNFEYPDPTWINRRSHKRSYNVPMLTRDTRSVNMLWGCEYPTIRFLERNGYSVTYWSGIDTSTKELTSSRFKLFLSVGHDEYWSASQRQHVENARDNEGIHLVFFSGNEAYWRIRFEDNHRTLVVYKDTQASSKLDPVEGEWTGTWRDASPNNPVGAMPENSLTGCLYTVNAWRNDPLEVPYEYSKLRFWRHTEVATLKPGQRAILMKGLLGHEWNEDINNGFRPAGLMHMSRTTIHNVQYIFDAGATYDTGSATHHLVLYKKNKSLVWGTGTVQWMWGLDDTHDTSSGVPNLNENEYNTRIGVDSTAPEKAVQQATVNMFKDMGVVPGNLIDDLVVDYSETVDNNPPTCTIKDYTTKGSVSTIFGTAVDIEGVVSSVEISLDDGLSWHRPQTSFGTPHASWEYATSQPITGSILCRSTDDSGNTVPTPSVLVVTNSQEEL
eukprot:TRINITY_DN8607_c0_g1_i1.p1 TRINITY_DN8607_c0_g1~~TRINITY_DN8607_c0_g1_i1.p1  ORF type:complete len:718 (+),score=112.63 TRINITY_DN8607_c0_g1_i1:48-2201(+)